MDDLISRRAAIDALHMHLMYRMGTDSNKKRLDEWINNLPSAQPDNQINLCDSCDYLYPECPAKNDDVIFGNGIGNDNICACNKYKPSAQSEPHWIPCSERLPSKDGKYIVTEKRYAVDDRNHDGKHTVIVEEVNWWGKWERAKFYEVTAWMPLPEPYKEGGEQE